MSYSFRGILVCSFNENVYTYKGGFILLYPLSFLEALSANRFCTLSNSNFKQMNYFFIRKSFPTLTHPLLKKGHFQECF